MCGRVDGAEKAAEAIADATGAAGVLRAPGRYVNLWSILLFLFASCDSGHGATRGVVLNFKTQGLGEQEFPDVLSSTPT